jgi:hypothetical protein
MLTKTTQISKKSLLLLDNKNQNQKVLWRQKKNFKRLRNFKNELEQLERKKKHKLL